MKASECGFSGNIDSFIERWSVYEEFNELFILVPALLGLKGNLEMSLASCLSTALSHHWRSGHLELMVEVYVGEPGPHPVQLLGAVFCRHVPRAQAIVVALLATAIALVVEQDFSPSHILLLVSSSVFSASVASALLASLMILIILTSQRLRINPDNVATPFAASLGEDLVTLGLLSMVAQGLYRNEVVHVPMAIALVTILLVPIPLWCYLAYHNPITHNVLLFGWIPVITAMCISSGGGYVLAKAIGEWPSIAAYTPIINGIGGNLVAVQASHISTSLHSNGVPGVQHSSQMYMGPHGTFFSLRQDSKTAMVLVLLVIPGSTLFLFVVHAMDLGHTVLTPPFMAGYVLAAVLQVVVLLMVADWMVRYVWKMGWDPDNIAIPFLTALGDLLGTSFLALCFLITGRSRSSPTNQISS
ncbi:hypothetical protein EMCRGX_G003116 [Ephydatia muelleri]